MFDPRSTASDAYAPEKINVLPGVPLVESPFFEELLQTIPPDLHAAARSLHEVGFAVIEFPDPDLSARAERIKASLTARFDWDLWRRKGWRDQEGLRVQDAYDQNEDVYEIATNRRLLEILGVLYGRRAFPFQTLNFPVGSQQHFHTDAIHFSCIPERFMCGVWVALEDIGPEQGPLIYYPGSHRWPIYTNEHIDFCSVGAKGGGPYTRLWTELVRVHGLKEARFTPRRGQALIWAANLLHGGAPQLNPYLTRWSQVTHYYFENCAYYTPLFSEPFFGKIHFREPANLIDGTRVKNRCHGFEVPLPFVEMMSSGSAVLSQETFDAVSYLTDHPDVAAAGVDPWKHYVEHGMREGRRARLIGSVDID